MVSHPEAILKPPQPRQTSCLVRKPCARKGGGQDATPSDFFPPIGRRTAGALITSTHSTAFPPNAVTLRKQAKPQRLIRLCGGEGFHDPFHGKDGDQPCLFGEA